jgi:hypothetical protein
MSLAGLLGAPPDCAFNTDNACNGYCRALLEGRFGEGPAAEGVASIIYIFGASYLARVHGHCTVRYGDEGDDDDAKA